MKQRATGNNLIDRYNYQMGRISELPGQEPIDNYIIGRERIKRMAQERQELIALKKYIEEQMNEQVIKELKNLPRYFK
jgi:hypothetical protein